MKYRTVTKDRMAIDSSSSDKRNYNFAQNNYHFIFDTFNVCVEYVYLTNIINICDYHVCRKIK